MMSKKNHILKSDMPRERLSIHGAEVLRDVELLALFLRTGRVGRHVLEIAEDLLSEWGSLRRIAGCSLEELSQMRGIGPAKAAELKAAFEMGRRMMTAEEQTPILKEGKEIYDFMCPHLQTLPYESLWVLLLDVRLRLIERKEVSRGSLTQSIAHPREVFKWAIAKRAYAIVLAHNHPSGDPTPSESDIRFTKRLVQAGDFLQFPLVDHVIIGTPALGREPYYSFFEAGMI
ncbi:MAG: JAB domain-containing protein [Verrucomicrobia bacterium]|nr:JAB domain-containing protein [Verrucomicrobiota bacterium]